MPKAEKHVLETIATSSAANKLADTVQGIVNHLVGPKRLIETAQAEAQANFIKAKGELAVDELRRISADRGRSPDERRDANVAAVIYEGFAALPSPTAAVSDDEVSDDFILRFFDDAKNVSDAQMQQLWGRLLAGEVVQPGTYHPTTLTTLKNMRKDDADAFARLCRLRWVIEKEPVVMLSVGDKPQLDDVDLNFDHLIHFESLGLLRMDTSNFGGSFAIGDLMSPFPVTYHDTRMTFRLPDGKDEIRTGNLILTRPGAELSGLVTVDAVPGHMDAVLARWKAEGVEVQMEGNP